MPKIVMYAAATQHQQMVKCAIMDTIVGGQRRKRFTSRELGLGVSFLSFQKNRTTEGGSFATQSRNTILVDLSGCNYSQCFFSFTAEVPG